MDGSLLTQKCESLKPKNDSQQFFFFPLPQHKSLLQILGDLPNDKQPVQGRSGGVVGGGRPGGPNVPSYLLALNELEHDT